MNAPAGGEGQRIGEVVEAHSHEFTAQCYRLYASPHLGALARIDSPTPEGEDGATSMYGVVYAVSTAALDPGRHVVPRGEDAEREEEVYQSHPQLERLLATRFEALIVGYGNGDAFHQYLPPLPPRVHSFVYTTTPTEVAQFTGSLDYLNLLVHSSPAGRGITDEVVAACLRQAGACTDDPRGFLVRTGKALASLLAGDLPRLNAVLRRLSP